MPTLKECMSMIGEMAKRKGWTENPAIKIYYGMIEFGEAGDVWKHRDDEKYLKEIGLTKEMVEDAVCIEIIDALLYAVHAVYCINPDRDLDKDLLDKMKINEERDRTYADDFKGIK